MLSILIPTYNFDCSVFVQALSNQAEALHVPYDTVSNSQLLEYRL